MRHWGSNNPFSNQCLRRSSTSAKLHLLHLHRVTSNQLTIMELEETCSELDRSLSSIITRISDHTKLKQLSYQLQHLALFWLDNLREHTSVLQKKLQFVTNQKQVLKQKSETLKEMHSSFKNAATVADPELSAQELLCDFLSKLDTRRLELLSQLQLLYPISIPNGARPCCYSIRGIEIPSHQPQNTDDDTMSSALGYACHLVLMIAKYFSIALRYKIHYRGSRSYISDEVSPIKGLTEYPLYTKGVERAKFECAVILLNRVVDQILRNRNIDASISQIQLENPTRLFDNLFRFFQNELPGGDEIPVE